MARPHYAQSEDTARERLKRAFWERLQELPYHKLTARDVTRAAGVNKNTFYYHYESLDELAREAVTELLDPRFVLALSYLVRGGANPKAATADLPGLTDELAALIDRVCILASCAEGASASGTGAFRRIVRDAVGCVWQEAFGFDVATLPQDKRLIYEFALGGFLSVLAYRAQCGNKIPLENIVCSDLARPFFALLEELEDPGRRAQIGDATALVLEGARATEPGKTQDALETLTAVRAKHARL